jgi:ADP-heptose:LPS heptosyltransferase
MRLRDPIKKVIELRRRLRPFPGHFRQMSLRFVHNVGRLCLLRLRAWLTGRKLVVIELPERLGDIIACTPFAGRHRRENPRDLIVWAARSAYTDVLRGNPDLDGLLPLYCITDWILLRNLLCLADKTYDLSIPPKYCEKCWRWCVKGDTPWNVNSMNYFDFGTLLSAHSRAAGFPLDEGEPSVPINERAPGRVDRLGLPNRFVCVHTKSEDNSKDWRSAHWNRLIDHLNDVYGMSVVEIGLCSPLARKEDGGYHNICGLTSIAESVVLIRRAALFIGIDSGPAHLANAVKTPGIVLLGRHRVWDQYMPYTGFYADPRNCRIVRHSGPASELPLGSCIIAIDEFLRERSGSMRITGVTGG